MGQVEVGQHAVDPPPSVAGGDEDAGVEGGGQGLTGVGEGGVGLDDAGGGGADGEHATPRFAGAADGVDGLRRHRAVLGVDGVLLDELGLDGFEGAGADVEGDLGALNADGGELGEERGGEVEAGGGRGDGTRAAARGCVGGREGRLVAVAVELVGD
jgi:hypothetical protein